MRARRIAQVTRGVARVSRVTYVVRSGAPLVTGVTRSIALALAFAVSISISISVSLALALAVTTTIALSVSLALPISVSLEIASVTCQSARIT